MLQLSQLISVIKSLAIILPDIILILLVEGCIDDEGSVRSEGENWRKSDDPCQVCLCQQGMSAFFLLCPDPIY